MLRFAIVDKCNKKIVGYYNYPAVVYVNAFESFLLCQFLLLCNSVAVYTMFKAVLYFVRLSNFSDSNMIWSYTPTLRA